MIRTTPEDEIIMLGGDLNGHVGRCNANIRRVHGGWGVGERNEEGEQIVDFAMAFDLAIANTFFQKKESQMFTYKSGNRESQIDLFLCRKRDSKDIVNCKVIKGECVAPQHRLVVADLALMVERVRRREQRVVKTKWWKLKEDGSKLVFNEVVNRKIEDLGDRSWNAVSGIVKETGEHELGKTSGK